MLVARHGRHGNGPAQNLRPEVSDHLRRVHHLRQHRAGNVQHAQQLVVPLLGVKVKEHRAAGVGRVGHVRTPLHQMPGQEAVHRAEAQLALLRALAQVQRIQQPRQLRPAEVGVRHKARLFPDGFAMPLAHQLLHIGRGAAALPHDGVVHAAARVLLPQQGGLALVGDADGRDVAHVHLAHLHGLLQGFHLGAEDVVRVVLHPAGLGIALLKLDRVRGKRAPRLVKDDGAAGCGALVQCH